MNFLKYTWFYFLISFLIILPGTYSLARYGLKLSIDFTGGTLLEIKAPKTNGDEIKKIAKEHEIDIVSISNAGADEYILRAKPLEKEQIRKLEDDLKKRDSSFEEKRLETVGPTIGNELTQKAFSALILASIMIVVYLAFTFRQVPSPANSWKFGLTAVAAVLHDVLVLLGIFSLLGHFENVEVDALFVTAALTVVGFSVHDTIVVYDRIRENLKKHPELKFGETANLAINQTLKRSLSTSFTVVLTLLALLFFGGETLRWFVVALLVGIVSGTYSSIFNATPLLVIWQDKTFKMRKTF